MSGVTQATFMNQRSFGPPAIGAAYEGGFFAGQIGVSGVATHNIIVAPRSTGEVGNTAYSSSPSTVSGADSNINGPQNTADIVADGDAIEFPAAHFCNNLVVGGFSDWYFPAKNELEVCYYNLKATTTSNNINSGQNTNAVPQRNSNYTAGTPAQTSAAAFQTGGSEAFTAAYYWTSTDFSVPSSGRAMSQQLGYGAQYDNLQSRTYRVRAIRRVAV